MNRWRLIQEIDLVAGYSSSEDIEDEKGASANGKGKGKEKEGIQNGNGNGENGKRDSILLENESGIREIFWLGGVRKVSSDHWIMIE